MIEKLSHTSVYVLDQDSALAFYRDKLGFEVRNDNRMEGFRWITVGPKTQPGLELILMPIAESPMMPAETAAKLRDLVKRGTFGIGVFETSDCRKTFEELKAKGVEFMAEPTERFYGIEALMKDDSGNWFSMCQRSKA
jgi:predicted enzyme related to lactoylglutathione lyase